MKTLFQSALVAFCLCLAGCGGNGRGTVYQKPLTEMHDALAEVNDLPPVFGSNVPDLSMDTSDPSSVAWIVNLHGSEVMRFVATLQPEGNSSTRMVLDLVGVTSGSSGDVAKRLKDHPELKRLYLVAMTEEIDSTLEKRAYDMSRTYPALMAATAANVGEISKRMDEAAAADRKRDEDNIRKAYADEAAGN